VNSSGSIPAPSVTVTPRTVMAAPVLLRTLTRSRWRVNSGTEAPWELLGMP
jgi:hypothetical protein